MINLPGIQCFQLKIISFRKSVTLTHGNLSIDHYIVGIGDDSVDDRIGNRTVIIGVGVDSLVPSFGMILSTEYHRTLDTSLDDLQQVVAFVRLQLAKATTCLKSLLSVISKYKSPFLFLLVY